VFIVDFYDDEENVWHGIPEFNVLENNITVPGLSSQYPDVHCMKDGGICQVITAEGGETDLLIKSRMTDC
jgi:purine nucleoside permease